MRGLLKRGLQRCHRSPSSVIAQRGPGGTPPRLIVGKSMDQINRTAALSWLLLPFPSRLGTSQLVLIQTFARGSPHLEVSHSSLRSIAAAWARCDRGFRSRDFLLGRSWGQDRATRSIDSAKSKRNVQYSETLAQPQKKILACWATSLRIEES